MLRIVPFSEPYTEAVVAVILPIQQHEFGIPISLDAQPDLLSIRAFYQVGSGNFWVALVDDEVVGTIALLDIGNSQGALRKMFVKTGYRGCEHGVAKALLDTLLEWCAQRGVADVFLGTTDKFLAAHRFYEKHGFVSECRDGLPAAFPVMAVDTKFYRRSVPSACAFCAIASGLAPADIVYSDAATIAFVDLRQFHPGHMLVIPRAHVPDVRDLDDATGAAVMATVARVTRAVARAFPNEGLSLWHSIGPAAFQEVPHLHVHIHPRLAGDDFLRVYPAEPPTSLAEDRARYAAMVRQALGK